MAIFGVGALVMSYGFYIVRPQRVICFRAADCVTNQFPAHLIQVGQTNIQHRADKAEKEAVRRALVPVLQAEEDRRYWIM